MKLIPYSGDELALKPVVHGIDKSTQSVYQNTVRKEFLVCRLTTLITGVTGQDGAYLAQLLLQKGYTVHGMKRRASSFNTQRIDDIYTDPHDENVKFFMHYGDLTDSSNIMRLIQTIEPDEIITWRRKAMCRLVRDGGIYRQCRCVWHIANTGSYSHSETG